MHMHTYDTYHAVGCLDIECHLVDRLDFFHRHAKNTGEKKIERKARRTSEATKHAHGSIIPSVLRGHWVCLTNVVCSIYRDFLLLLYVPLFLFFRQGREPLRKGIKMAGDKLKCMYAYVCKQEEKKLLVDMYIYAYLYFSSLSHLELLNVFTSW